MRSHALVPLSLLLILACGPTLADPDQGTAEASQEEVEFTFSADPTVTVLKLIPPSAGYIGGYKVYTLYGDGRLQMTEGTHRQVHHTREAQLSHFETEDLLRVSIEHGLMEIDTQGLERKMTAANAGTRVPVGQDFGAVSLTVNLESYTRAGIPGPITNSLRLEAPSLRSSVLPDLPEIKGLMVLLKTTREYWKSSEVVEEGGSSD